MEGNLQAVEIQSQGLKPIVRYYVTTRMTQEHVCNIINKQIAERPRDHYFMSAGSQHQLFCSHCSADNCDVATIELDFGWSCFPAGLLLAILTNDKSKCKHCRPYKEIYITSSQTLYEYCEHRNSLHLHEKLKACLTSQEKFEYQLTHTTIN